METINRTWTIGFVGNLGLISVYASVLKCWKAPPPTQITEEYSQNIYFIWVSQLIECLTNDWLKQKRYSVY